MSGSICQVNYPRTSRYDDASNKNWILPWCWVNGRRVCCGNKKPLFSTFSEQCPIRYWINPSGYGHCYNCLTLKGYCPLRNGVSNGPDFFGLYIYISIYRPMNRKLNWFLCLIELGLFFFFCFLFNFFWRDFLVFLFFWYYLNFFY